MEEEKTTREEFVHWNRAALSFISQKTKAEWLVQGDANTRYFHSVLKKNYYQKRIYTITSAEGDVITDYLHVANHFQDYYICILGTVKPREGQISSNIIAEEEVLTIEQQLNLLREVTAEEIKEVVWSIPIHKSPGSDRYGSGFYRKA